MFRSDAKDGVGHGGNGSGHGLNTVYSPKMEAFEVENEDQTKKPLDIGVPSFRTHVARQGMCAMASKKQVFNQPR
jgi:hypothetical protein